jgi:ABC-type multidrug transport system permease subunit
VDRSLFVLPQSSPAAKEEKEDRFDSFDIQSPLFTVERQLIEFTLCTISHEKSSTEGLLDAGIDYVGTVMQKILPEIQPEVVSSPLFQRMPPIYGQLDPSFRDYVAPALVLAVTYAMSVGLTALAFVQERKEGLFERSLVSGVNTLHIFFAHFIVEFCMVLIQSLVMLFFMFVVFKVPIYGSVWLVVALTLAQGQSNRIRSSHIPSLTFLSRSFACDCIKQECAE